MKKSIIILLCIVCISLSATAQSVRLGNVEIIVSKRNQNGTSDDPSTFTKFNQKSTITGIGFMLPNNSSGYFTTIGGNSINFDVGRMQRYHLTRHFALGTTVNYSYYNYKLRDAFADPFFNEEVRNDKPFAENNIRKEVFRSHNAAAGAFSRFYLVAPRTRDNDGLFIDLGAQGDFAFSKYYLMKFNNGGKDKFRNGYAFNPFTASAIARVGWKTRSGNPAIFVRYRLTDAFNMPMDLPPVTVGIQFL